MHEVEVEELLSKFSNIPVLIETSAAHTTTKDPCTSVFLTLWDIGVPFTFEFFLEKL